MTNSGAVKVYRKPHCHSDRHRGFSVAGTSVESYSRATKIHAVHENPDDERSEESEVKTKHSIHRQSRRRSMSLDETDFIAHLDGKRFAQYSNREAQLGLGENVARRTYTRRSKENDSQENADEGGSFKMNSQQKVRLVSVHWPAELEMSATRADPLQKKVVIDQLRHILKNHKEGDTDKLHPNRPGRMSRMIPVRDASPLRRHTFQESFHSTMPDERNDSWNERLGNPAPSEIDSLKDKRGELIRKIEKPHKHPSRDKQMTHSLREQRSDLWSRTASTE